MRIRVKSKEESQSSVTHGSLDYLLQYLDKDRDLFWNLTELERVKHRGKIGITALNQ
jgi:hypothetical protein